MIEDSAGRIVVVTHPTADAALATGWQVWHNPLTDLQDMGLDVTSVKRMIIGIGDRNNAQLGGPGLIHIDDIWVTKQMP